MRRLKIIAGLFSFISVFFFLQCECPECFTPPVELILRVIDQNDSTDIIFSGKSNNEDISLYYFENNFKKIIEFEILNDTVNKKSYLISGYPGFISSTGIREFYLELNDSDIDTMFYDVEEQTDDCCTFFRENEFRYNGKTIKKDKDFVYLIVK